jgi:2-polyprenyl-3-methyl-5-hydroxy-6-metoxy-1,4-benzoquinol methylase
LERSIRQHITHTRSKQKVPTIALKGKEFLDRLKFNGILDAIGKPPGSFLDIGCGNGRYMDFFANRGIPKKSIYGLELSEQTTEQLRAKGYNAYCRRVEDCTEIPDKSIDLATMFHVIEHIDDPKAVVKQIATWLAAGGHLSWKPRISIPGTPGCSRAHFGGLPHSPALDAFQ